MHCHHIKFDPIDSIIYHDIWDVKVHSSLLAFNNNDNTVLQQENLHRCFGPIKGSNQPAELHMTLITQDKPVQSFNNISVANDQGAKIHRLICAFILHYLHWH